MTNFLTTKLLLLPLALLLWLPFTANAQVTKTDGNLEVTFESEPLFDAQNIAPGFSETKTVTVKNNGTDIEDVYVSVANATSSGLADYIDLIISSTSTTPTQLFSGTFAEFFNQSPIDLGDLPAGEEFIYTYTADFVSTSTFAYGGTSMSFNLVVGFESGPTVVSNGGGGGSGGGGGFIPDSDPVPQVAGVSTDNPFWADLFERANQMTEESLRSVRGLVLGEATTSAQELGTTTALDDEEELGTGFGEFIIDWCLYVWFFVVLWLLASAGGYWRQSSAGDMVTMSAIQIIFGVIALILLFLSFIYTSSCLFWPALIVGVGSVCLHFYTRE